MAKPANRQSKPQCNFKYKISLSYFCQNVPYLVHLNVTEDNGNKVPAVFYQSANGNQPVREWLLNRTKADRKTIGTDVKTGEFGWPVGMPVCRPMKNGLHEVRTNLDDGRIARVLFCFHGGNMVLLHGFIKKSQQTPKPDFDIALKRKREVEHG